MKRLPKVTCKTDIPGLWFHGVQEYGHTIFSTLSVPEISFDYDDQNPAYDYLCADGFVNFPKMYRENLTGFPYFHSDFWNEDVLPPSTYAQGVSYAALTGYDASKSDEENLPYVAAHFENRSQCYIRSINPGGLKQNSRITNFDDFAVSFDYKMDGYSQDDPFYPAGYSFLYSQPVNTTAYGYYQIHIVNVSGGCILVTGRPDTAYIDYDTGAVTGNNNYFTGILQIDFTEWHSVRIETIQKDSGSVIFVYIDNVLIPFHFNNATYDRADGGIDTDSGHLSGSFLGFNTRNAYYTGDYWYKNFRIANRPQHFEEIRWGVLHDNAYEYYTENHFAFAIRNLYNANAYQREGDIRWEGKSELCENYLSAGPGYLYINVLARYCLALALAYDNSSETFGALNYPALHTVNMTDEQLQITDNNTIYDNAYKVGYVYWPLEENDQDYYANDGTYQTAIFVHPHVDNASFIDKWCVLTPDKTNYITYNVSNPKNYGYSIELFIRITEADSAAMSGTVKIMRLNTFSVSGLYADNRVFWFGYIPALNTDHDVLGYWAIFSAENVVCKFPHFKNKAVSHLAFRMVPNVPDYYFRRLCVYINGSLAFHIFLRERSSLSNFGQLFDSAGNSGFSGAIRGLRIITNQEVYPAIVDESRAFFSNKDIFYLQDVFSDIELGLDRYWDRVTEVMADPYFDPFTLYPDYAFPETQNDYVFGNPVITWQDERTGEELGTGSITEEITRNTKFRGDFSFENTAKGISVFMPPEGYVEMTINRQIPPTAVIVSAEGMTVYKGAYVLLDGSGSYDEITGYLWSNGATTDKISVQIMETTTFTLTVTNPYGTDSATITIICKEVPEISKKADIVSVTVIGQEIPLSPIPYQELMILLNGQNCIITVRQLGLFLYCSLSVDGRKIFSNVICSINARVNVFKSPYFTGILRFYDTQGTERPHYSELGSRWILVYRAEELPGEFE